MSRPAAVVVGAGMGGLTAALRLARHGFHVRVFEAREEAGGLASGFEAEGFSFDAGPYILLDRPGLEWAFRALGHDLADHVELRPIDEVYDVSSKEGPPLRFFASLEETADGFDRLWPGSGSRYRSFVRSVTPVYNRLRPLLHVSRPGPLSLLRGGAWRSAGFLLRSLGAVLDRTGLPPPLRDALAIWTHVAAQPLSAAPSVLAFVPVLFHDVGAFYPAGGVAEIPRALAGLAAMAGVEFEYRTKVRRIACRDGRVTGIETEQGQRVDADAVVSDAGGPATYLELLPDAEPRVARRLARLPLQSPGVCAYIAARGSLAPPYLRFLLPGGAEPPRLWIRPAVIDPGARRGEWWPARLLSPMAHAAAERAGRTGQREHLDRVLAEGWWREGVTEVRVVERRVPAEWGAQYHLYRDSMNPVMTAGLMRAGRLAHRSPHVRGLYLAGSSTHPGQWVSFCAISGILAADCVREDVR